jgi:hypothetical protein
MDCRIKSDNDEWMWEASRRAMARGHKQKARRVPGLSVFDGFSRWAQKAKPTSLEMPQ